MVDSSAVGMSFPVSHARIEPVRLRFFLDTLGETNPVYRDEKAAEAAGLADRPVPPTYLFCLEFLDGDDPLKVFDALEVDIARVLHGEQNFIYRAPVYVGDALTFRSSVTGVQDKKGGALTLVDVATEVINQRGERSPIASASSSFGTEDAAVTVELATAGW